MDKRYYYVVVWIRDSRPHADRGWQPSVGAMDKHPLLMADQQWREGESTQRELVSWQEITKEEYAMYQKLNA